MYSPLEEIRTLHLVYLFRKPCRTFCVVTKPSRTYLGVNLDREVTPALIREVEGKIGLLIKERNYRRLDSFYNALVEKRITQHLPNLETFTIIFRFYASKRRGKRASPSLLKNPNT
eukprot:TRINITY_DN327_c1_g1_i1.p1 TRINITY_DN327_c1_g1~~TRINITY_DN327_c1_g1_i1.p1  ORF type:complete len:116 (-),score=10.95 TRINITY_DN327_c1_g1_i1:7-354(-)